MYLSQGCCTCTQVVIPPAQYWAQSCSIPLMMIHSKNLLPGLNKMSNRDPQSSWGEHLPRLQQCQLNLSFQYYNGKRKCQCSLSAGFRPPFPKILLLLPQKVCHSSLLLQSFQNKLKFQQPITTDLGGGEKRVEENPLRWSSCFPQGQQQHWERASITIQARERSINSDDVSVGN